MSFWRVWLLNFRQRINCANCSTDLYIDMPGRIAAGTILMLLVAGAAYMTPGGRGLGFAFMLFTVVGNFVLTHHFVQLLKERPDDTAD